jgi:hypothetical protein
MDAPSISLLNYTFPFEKDDFSTAVQFKNADKVDVSAYVRSVELESINGAANGCWLTLEGDDNVLLNFPSITPVEKETYRKIPLKFVVGYTDYDDEDYDDADVMYTTNVINVYATEFGDADPVIYYIENLASKAGESESVVIHGGNLTDGLSIKLFDGENEYVIPPEDIVFDIEKGTATFTIAPGMLDMNDDGTEPCGQYEIYFSYGDQNYGNSGLALIRYKYDAETEEMQRYSVEAVTREKACYDTGEFSLVFDNVDENGNAVLNAKADPRYGESVVVRRQTASYYEQNHYVYHENIDSLYGFMKLKNTLDEYGNPTIQIMQYGELYNVDDDYAEVNLWQGYPIYLDGQTNSEENGLWFVTGGVWVRDPCEAFVYTMVRVKHNKNLTHKAGLLKLDGVQLYDGDVVWLSHQLREEENGLWVVRIGEWEGFNPYEYNPISPEPLDCPANCHKEEVAFPVTDFVLVDLGAKATYQVDYVCRDDVPYKCGTRTICNYKVSPGHVVALLNQKDGGDGIYLVKCGEWEKIGDVSESDVSGTTIDFSHQVIVQNDIDFCQCGGVFHIDYFFLTPSCYLNHLQRSVKIMCGDASIAPNPAESQFSITEYVIRVGEEDALIGYQGRTPGDPVKEDCVEANDDFEYDFGLTLVERRQYVKNPSCLRSPICEPICDVPRIFNLRTTKDYTNSNDRNGFTIKFWRHEEDGWHLYAYIGSGMQNTGMDYYVYHLHVKGKATENQVDVNEHDWFTVTTGYIADGDGLVYDDENHIIGSDSFGLYDDKWEFEVVDSNGDSHIEHTLNRDTLYMPWRISCTTNLLAHGSLYDHEPRTTCQDMEMGSKTIEAIGDVCDYCNGTGIDDNGDKCAVCDGTGRSPSGYLVGMLHVFDVAYYTTAMTKSQFVAEYNKYASSKTDCIWYEFNEVIATDDEDPIVTDDNELIRR